MIKARICFICWVLVIIFAATWPWSDFRGHAHWDNVRWIPFQDASPSFRFIFDLFGNVMLFIPFGYLFVRSYLRRSRYPVLRAALMGFLMSASIELFQVYCHNHIPSATDLLSNIIGAALGGAVVRITKWRGI